MKSNEDSQKSLTDVLTMVKCAFGRYWRVSLGPAIAVLGLVILVGRRVPDYYTSEALLHNKPTRLTITKLIEKSSDEEQRQRMDGLIQEVLSRPRLLGVIDRFNLYPELVGPGGKEIAVARLRSNLKYEFPPSSTGDPTFQTFRLRFTHEDKNTAYKVTQALSNLFIDESMFDRTSEIQGSKDFLDGQLDSARKKLESTENQVQEFIRTNFGKLPEHLDGAIARLEQMQQQLAINSQMMQANLTRRQNIQAELADTKRFAPVNAEEGGNSRSGDPVDSLAQLESALTVLTSKYSDEHPDVVNTRKRIEALRSQIVSSGADKEKPSAPTRMGDPSAYRQVRRDLSDVEVQIASLQAENKRLKDSIDSLQADIGTMPVKEQELIKIKRDYENVKQSYDRLLAAREEAALQSSLVSSEKAQRFAIIEPAVEPVFPSGPDRALIVGIGLAVAVLLLIAIPFLLYLINPSYKFLDDLEQELSIPVLGIIPPMETPESRVFRKRLVANSLIASALSLAAGCLIIFWVV